MITHQKRVRFIVKARQLEKCSRKKSETTRELEYALDRKEVKLRKKDYDGIR